MKKVSKGEEQEHVVDAWECKQGKKSWLERLASNKAMFAYERWAGLYSLQCAWQPVKGLGPSLIFFFQNFGPISALTLTMHIHN